MAGMDFHPNGDLPWGWWLRAEDGVLVDPDGRRWHSVREAFWEGRLGMRAGHLMREQQELMLRTLGMVDACFYAANQQHDIFGGDMMFWRFYMTWLGSIGLLDVRGRDNALHAPLTDEGRSALAMLRATRQPEWAGLPMAAVVTAVARANRDAADEAREAALVAFERGITPMPHIFAREGVGRTWLVTLTTLDLSARMPVRRRSWSVSFLDERQRDDLFGWLAEQVHRWDDWGTLAHGRGARALTSHLLSLLVVHPPAWAGRRSADDVLGSGASRG